MLRRMLAAATPQQILIVDRDLAAIEPLREKLQQAGFAVRTLSEGGSAIIALQDSPPHLVILDWDTPGLAVLELIERVRRGRIPHAIRLIILSQLSGEHDVVSGLDLGADDYITKPFSVREALARACAILRPRPRTVAVRELSSDHLTLDTSTNQVIAQGTALHLRGAEFRLLEFLMSHPGKIFNRSQLLTHVWAGDASIDERTVDVNVQRLRKILAAPGYEHCIQTVRGFGYRFMDHSRPSHF
jgi:two-component system, OmpR family, phosphate regulon response regulator PhoB